MINRLPNPPSLETLFAGTPPGEQPLCDIFTDGACSGNPGPGGWGAVIVVQGQEIDFCGGEQQTTNNRMEMMAAIKSLEQLPLSCRVNLHTDSRYLQDGVTKWMANWKRNGWMTADKKPVKNQDLWQRIDSVSRQHTIEWKWVKGHNGHELNERADALARAGIVQQQMQQGF